MKFFLLIIIVFFPNFTYAEEVSRQTFCHILPPHIPSDDVEYRPGMDVHGKPVVPADIGDNSAMQGFETYEIPVEIDLIQRFGLNVRQGADLKPYAALITIHKDGRVDYNGQDISRQAYELCNKGGNND